VICKLTERHEIARKLSEERGFTLIPPYDDYDIMAGQGTVGVEVLEQLPDVDYIVVPIGGGGLIGGVSTAIKALKPSVKVIGAEPARMPRYTRSIEAGMPVTIEESKCIADALLTLRPGDRNFPIIRSKVDEIVTTEDEFMAMGMRLLLLEGRILSEPSSAVGVGAALMKALPVKPGDKVCFVISGGSVGLEQVQRILAEAH
jgi:threonine dehydratase